MGISYKPPVAAVNQTCTACGSTVYCGGPVCPNSGGLLPLSPDGEPQVSTIYVSVAVLNPVTGRIVPQVG